MHKLFEYIDVLNSPYEAFIANSDVAYPPVHPHWHYFIEVIYLIDGSVQVECDGKQYKVSAGELFLFHSKSIHAFYQIDGVSFRYAVLKFDVNALGSSSMYTPSFRYVLKQAQETPEISNLFTNQHLKGYPIADLVMRCINEMQHMHFGYDIAMHSHLCVLMTYLIRIWRQQGFKTTRLIEEAKDELDLDRIIEYIDSHSGEPIKVQNLAKMCNMSYSYFAKSFRNLYRKSCKEYIEYVRISKAQDLLLFTEYDLNYISQETGFSDCSHFIKTYKKIKGITPKKHKRKLYNYD